MHGRRALRSALTAYMNRVASEEELNAALAPLLASALLERHASYAPKFIEPPMEGMAPIRMPLPDEPEIGEPYYTPTLAGLKAAMLCVGLESPFALVSGWLLGEERLLDQVVLAVRRFPRAAGIVVACCRASEDAVRDCIKAAEASGLIEIHDEQYRLTIEGEARSRDLEAEVRQIAQRVLMPAPSPSTSAASASRPAPQAKVDFVIITALPEERDAVLGHFPDARKLPKDALDFHTYYQAELKTQRPDGATYRVIITCLAGMGPQRASAKAAAVATRWTPRHVLLVGIAGGVRGEVDLGDVLIAEQIADYPLGKVEFERGVVAWIRRKLGGSGRRNVRWQVYRTDPNLFDSSHNLEHGWEKLIRHARPGAGTPVRREGVIASGGDVIAFEELMQEYKSTWHKLIGVEMEGGGTAGTLDGLPNKPRFFMIRSASDFANPAKNAPDTKKWREYAYHVAAAYTFALLKEGPVPADGEPSAEAAGAVGRSAPDPSLDTRSRDLRALREFWLRLPTDQADLFFERAGYHAFPHSIMFYYDEIAALTRSSGFHIHDAETRTGIDAFVKPFLRTIARDEFFSELPGGNQFKFISSHQHDNRSEWEKELGVFQSSVGDAHAAYDRLVALMHEKWPEIDLEETSREARERRRREEEG